MRKLNIRILLTFFLFFVISQINAQTKPTMKFNISYPEKFGDEGFDGRVLLIISDNDKEEPRFQLKEGAETQQVFGINVENLKPGETAIINASAPGYPIHHLSEIPPGEYWVQALLHKYDTFHLATGQTVLLPMDRGEGQHWNKSPQNLYSTPVKITIDVNKKETFSILLDQEIPAIEPAADTHYIKHIRIQSKLLSKFWGRPMYLQANVLVPEGFDKKSADRYPLMVFHGHFPHSIGGFRTDPPDADPNDEIYNERFRVTGYKYTQQREAYEFYQKWISPDFPRFVVIEIQHVNPYYDDSYAVNSANLGPYGDAITFELIPEVEKQFNCIGEGWGRFLYGGSTGGWEALAVQVFYPEQYNGCFAACPDPIDFRAYTVVDIYSDKNAYYVEGKFSRVPRPATRDFRGHVRATLESANRLEFVLGDHSRSGGQWDIWQAVYSPMGKDGYPQPIWDKLSGEIDPDVAEYWRENYDLRYIMQRDWEKIGQKLAGKINIYCGDMDNYYLNNAVVLTEEFLKKTENPHYGGKVDYGNGDEHCWNGDHDNPNAISRLRYNTMYLKNIAKRLQETAPEDHHLVNWGF